MENPYIDGNGIVFMAGFTHRVQMEVVQAAKQIRKAWRLPIVQTVCYPENLTQQNITVAPDEGYQFDGWKVIQNEEKKEGNVIKASCAACSRYEQYRPLILTLNADGREYNGQQIIHTD